MGTGELEFGTLQAINETCSKFPYSASLLLFTLIERILKQYIIEYRKDDSKVDHSFHKHQLNLGEMKDLENDEFVKSFIKEISLGDVEDILEINSKNKDTHRYSTKRNNLMHSNSFFAKEISYTKNEREEINISNFNVFIEDLKEVLRDYSDIDINTQKYKSLSIFNEKGT